MFAVYNIFTKVVIVKCNAFMSMYVFNVKCEQHALRSVRPSWWEYKSQQHHQTNSLSACLTTSQPASHRTNPTLHNLREERTLNQTNTHCCSFVFTCNAVGVDVVVAIAFIFVKLLYMIRFSVCVNGNVNVIHSQHCALEQQPATNDVNDSKNASTRANASTNITTMANALKSQLSGSWFVCLLVFFLHFARFWHVGARQK